MNPVHYPNELLRKKLAVAGIPETEHHVEALAAKIPEFDATALLGSPDALAEMLLYLIHKGIVTIPVRSDCALLDMPWGSHVCQFYEDKSELTTLLVPYFKQGLERNEACVWMLGDLTADEATTALRAAVPDLDRYLASGQMIIAHYSDLYTLPDGTVKPSAELSTAFVALASSVDANGYAGLRASGSVAWVGDGANMTRFMDYETQVNVAIQNAKIMAVCTYPAHAAALCQCRELIHNHGRIYVQRGQWVHDKSRDAQNIETVFAALAATGSRGAALNA